MISNSRRVIFAGLNQVPLNNNIQELIDAARLKELGFVELNSVNGEAHIGYILNSDKDYVTTVESI